MARSRSFQEELGVLMRRRKLSQADVVRSTGISQGWVNSMVRGGQVPSREMLGLLAERLELEPHERTRLFGTAGYVDGAAPPVGDQWPEPVAEVAEDLLRLSPEDFVLARSFVRRLVSETSGVFA